MHSYAGFIAGTGMLQQVHPRWLTTSLIGFVVVGLGVGAGTPSGALANAPRYAARSHAEPDGHMPVRATSLTAHTAAMTGTRTSMVATVGGIGVEYSGGKARRSQWTKIEGTRVGRKSQAGGQLIR